MIHKTIATVGRHHAHDGLVVANRQRIRHWADGLRRMIAKGIKASFAGGTG